MPRKNTRSLIVGKHIQINNKRIRIAFIKYDFKKEYIHKRLLLVWRREILLYLKQESRVTSSCTMRKVGGYRKSRGIS